MLSKEIKERIEANRLRALAIKAQKQSSITEFNVNKVTNCFGPSTSTSVECKIDEEKSNSVFVARKSVNKKGHVAKRNKAVEGICVMISKERFEIICGYSPPLIDVLKTHETALYGTNIFEFSPIQ